MAKKKSPKLNSAALDKPQTRTEHFLAKIAGLVDTIPEGEYTRLERYLKIISESSGFTPTEEQLAAMNSGATAEIISSVPTKLPMWGMGENLLDNWDFSNPGNIVNQRGVTSASSGSYAIDRWSGVYSIGANGMTFGATNEYAIQKFIATKMQNWDGKQFTASILYSDGTLETGTRIYRASSDSYNFISSGDIQFNKRADGSIMLYCKTPASVKAVKFELGTDQTLAHNEGTEGSPVWELNEYQDYGDELVKCQRRQVMFKPENTYSATSPLLLASRVYVSTADSRFSNFSIPLPATLVKKPTPIFSNIVVADNIQEYPVTSINVVACSSGLLALSVGVESSLSTSTEYRVIIKTDGYLLLDSN